MLLRLGNAYYLMTIYLKVGTLQHEQCGRTLADRVWRVHARKPDLRSQWPSMLHLCPQVYLVDVCLNASRLRLLLGSLSGRALFGGEILGLHAPCLEKLHVPKNCWLDQHFPWHTKQQKIHVATCCFPKNIVNVGNYHWGKRPLVWGHLECEFQRFAGWTTAAFKTIICQLWMFPIGRPLQNSPGAISCWLILLACQGASWRVAGFSHHFWSLRLAIADQCFRRTVIMISIWSH